MIGLDIPIHTTVVEGLSNIIVRVKGSVRTFLLFIAVMVSLVTL